MINQIKRATKALIIAAESNDFDGVVAAVNDGALVNTLETDLGGMPSWPGGVAALHWAAMNSNADILRFLIKHGADINQKSQTGRTPLHVAAQALAVDGVAVLLELGADPNIRGAAGETPLHLVTWELGDVSLDCADGAVAFADNIADAGTIAALLLQHGADPAIANVNGGVPFTAKHEWFREMVATICRSMLSNVGVVAREEAPSRGMKMAFSSMA